MQCIPKLWRLWNTLKGTGKRKKERKINLLNAEGALSLEALCSSANGRLPSGSPIYRQGGFTVRVSVHHGGSAVFLQMVILVCWAVFDVAIRIQHSLSFLGCCFCCRRCPLICQRRPLFRSTLLSHRHGPQWNGCPSFFNLFHCSKTEKYASGDTNVSSTVVSGS